MTTSSNERRSSPLQEKLALAAILLLALGLRLWGIGWGLPDALHNWSFHPDETVLLQVSLPEFPGGMNLAAGQFLPHYYHYGSLPFTLASAAVFLGQSYHLIGPLVSHGAYDQAQAARAYLAARLLSVVFGTATVWAAFALGRRCFGSAATGLLGAFFLAACPLHAQHSHYATVDIGATFWLTLSLLWAAKLLDASTTRERWRGAILAGIFAGLSAATKYSGVIALVGSLAAVAISARFKHLSGAQAIGLAAAACVACGAAFLAACPGSVLDSSLFLRDTRMESNHVMHQSEIYFQQTGPGWVYLVTRNLDAAMGLPLLLLSLAGLAYGCVRRRPGDWILLAVFAPTYLLIGAAQSRYARYDIPLLPLLAIWAARCCVEWSSSARESATGNLKQGALRQAAASAAALIGAFTLADCVALLMPMSQPDPRERAAVWMQAHASPADRVGLSGAPWFWTPPLDPNFCLPRPGAWQALAPGAEIAHFCYNPNRWLDPQGLESCRAKYVVLTEYQYADPLRLRWPSAGAYFADLRRDYGAPIVFRSTHPLGGARELDGLPVQDLPHDMLYPDPCISIYTRRSPA